jgi:hypothetical protein
MAGYIMPTPGRSHVRRAVGYTILAVAGTSGIFMAASFFKARDGFGSPLASGRDLYSRASGGVTTRAAAYAYKSAARSSLSDQSAADLPDRVYAALRSTDGAAWEAFCRDILPGLIREDPLSVAAIAVGLPAGYEREEALRLVGQVWGSRDGFAAMNWAAKLSDGDDRAASMANVSIGMSQSDPAAALVAAKQFGVPDNGGLYQNMVALWAERDAAGAFDWVDTLPAGPERDEMMERVAFAASKTSPADAAVLATDEIPDGPIRDEAVIAVLHQWAMHDIAAASSWITQFPQGPLRDLAEVQLQPIEPSR